MRNPSTLLCAILVIALCAAATSQAQESKPWQDPFALPGENNIVQEEHLGIVNGKITTSIPYKTVGAIKGMWAPPYASSDFQLQVKLLGKAVPTERYTWHPTAVERAGQLEGVAVSSQTVLAANKRGGVLEVTLVSEAQETISIPVEVSVSGTLDFVTFWEFGVSKSKTAVKLAIQEESLLMQQKEQAIVLRGSPGLRWDASDGIAKGTLLLEPKATTKFSIVFAMGPVKEAQATCAKLAFDPTGAITASQQAYQERVAEVYAKLPRLEASDARLVKFYDRSLAHFITNRWDVPEFLLKPNYTTGSVNGGCICNYLWDFGEPWEIFPLFDAGASRTHIKQFVAIDMANHFSFDPIEGKAWGPWYPVNQEKIVGLIYYYVKHTGDKGFLQERVADKTILEHVLANAKFGDDWSKPVAMIDYGPSNSHLELRRGFPYNHVMPDLNGRRYETYRLAAELADFAGVPDPQLLKRAEELKHAFKEKLWNAEKRWFDFQDAKGKVDTRYTIQMFKLFNSDVLDDEQEKGLLEHLNSETEFLSEFGLHSLAKTDIAYDQVDIDNGGGGSYTGFPPQIAERLYKAGHAASAENLLRRVLWWGERAPYWGDSFVANEVQYRQDTPLQNTIGSTSGAQAIIFGMFGVRVAFDGTVQINPQPPSFSPEISLKGLKVRGHVLDIVVKNGEYEVREGDRMIKTKVGTPVVVSAEGMEEGVLRGWKREW